MNSTFKHLCKKNSWESDYTANFNKTLSYIIKDVVTTFFYNSEGQYTYLSPANNEIIASN